MSGLLALAKPRRIKVSHRRRGKVASGPIVQRYYDPGIGRFLSVDPVTADTVTGWNFNRYNYAANNPYKFTDPDGRSIWTKLGKLALNGGNVAQTLAGVVEDVNTLRNPNESIGNRVLAGASLISEAAPISIGDVKDGAKIVGKIADKIDSLPKPRTGPGTVAKADRDPKRFFSPSDREAKRAGQGNQCGNGCGTKIDGSNSAGHHIERHADGGKTVPENHAEVCTDCHKKLHSGN